MLSSGAAVGAGLAGIGAQVTQAQQVDAGKRKKKPKAMTSKGIYPETVKAADAGYSPAVLAKGQKVLFISGQGPRDYNADMETQIRQTLQNIQTLLEEAGATWKNVVMVRAYFVHLSRDLAAFRKVRREFYVKPYPASTAIGTPELAIPGLQVEIEATAVI